MSITAGALLVARKEISNTIRKHLPNLTPMEVHRLSNQVYDGISRNAEGTVEYDICNYTESWMQRNIPGFRGT